MNDMNLFKKTDSIYLKKISSKSEISKNDSCDGYFLTTSESEARKIIEKLKQSKKIIALKGKNDKFNRRAIETLKINYLVSPESEEIADTLKQRNSGLNDFLCKTAKKKNITIVINISQVSKLEGKERALRIEKIIQNIKICKKNNCEIKIANLNTKNNNLIDEKARKSIGLSLGMSTLQAKNSTKF